MKVEEEVRRERCEEKTGGVAQVHRWRRLKSRQLSHSQRGATLIHHIAMNQDRGYIKSICHKKVEMIIL